MRLGLTGFQCLTGFPLKAGTRTDLDNLTVCSADGLQGFCSACGFGTKLWVGAHLDSLAPLCAT